MAMLPASAARTTLLPPSSVTRRSPRSAWDHDDRDPRARRLKERRLERLLTLEHGPAREVDAHVLERPVAERVQARAVDLPDLLLGRMKEPRDRPVEVRGS